jgi:hypothetical protein
LSYRSRRLGYLTFLGRYRGTPYQREEAGVSCPAVLGLRTRGPADDDEYAIGCDGCLGEDSEPQFHVCRQGRTDDVEAQLNGGLFLPRILTTGPNGPDETLLDFVTVEGNALGYTQHECTANSACSRTVRKGASLPAHDAIRHACVLRTHEFCRGGSLDSRLARVEMSASPEPIEVNLLSKGARAVAEYFAIRGKKDPIRPSPRLRRRDFRCGHPGTHVAGAVNAEDRSGPPSIPVVQTSSSPALTIVEYAKDHDIDMIVMGTHGRGALAHPVMGSVAERVVRLAPCPVLTVGHGQRNFIRPDTLATVANAGVPGEQKRCQSDGERSRSGCWESG